MPDVFTKSRRSEVMSRIRGRRVAAGKEALQAGGVEVTLSGMSFTGTVKDGVVVLPPGVKLPEGAEVELTIPVGSSAAAEGAFVLQEAAAPFPTVSGLPDDLAMNHDYYLHGHQHKKQPRRGRWIDADKPMPEMSAAAATRHTEQLLQFAAEIEGLPSDLAANHDHYLHGLPKK